AVAGNLTQAQLGEFAQGAKFQYAQVSNFNLGNGKFQAKVSIQNNSSVALPAGKGDWRIYIHSIRLLHESETAGLRVRHIQGDLHEIIPTEKFAGLAAGATLEFPYSGGNWIVSYTDFMPRA